MNKKILTLFSALFLALTIQAQTFEQIIYQAYVRGDMDAWENEIQKQSRLNNTDYQSYQLAMACYGFIGYCVGSDQKKRAEPFLEQGEAICEKLIENHPQKAEYLALRGAFYGLRLSFQPHKAMSLGPKSLKTLKQALEMAPESPYTLVEYANMDWWMPAVFGGSKDRALEGYEKAIQNLEKNPEQLKNNWFYLNIHMILARWYKEKGQVAKGNYLVKKVLQREPEFQWARELAD